MTTTYDIQTGTPFDTVDQDALVEALRTARETWDAREAEAEMVHNPTAAVVARMHSTAIAELLGQIRDRTVVLVDEVIEVLDLG